MLENGGSRIASRASTSVWMHRAMRPLPSLNGWISTRFRCAIAARTIARVSSGAFTVSTSSPDERLVEVEMRVLGERQDGRHRVPVSLQREARLGIGVERRLAGEHGGNVLQTRVV